MSFEEFDHDSSARLFRTALLLSLNDRAAAEDLLQELPPRQRTALVLRYFNGLSAAEIAEVLGCSMGTVQSPGIAGPGPAAGKHGTQRESTVSPRLEALLS